MKFKMFSILIITILICAVLSPFVYAIKDIRVEIQHQNGDTILKLIEETSEKNLIFNKKIGDIIIQYWIHVINNVEIKGDFILLHKTIDNNIQKYLKIWTDINIDLPNINDNKSNIEKIFWKKMILFTDNNDCLNFYKFYDNINYPIICWEVRYYNGYTILYDLNWNEIGYGTPAPSTGFSLSGYNDASLPDAWIEYRQSADNWFQKWCSSTNSVSFPTPYEISSILLSYFISPLSKINHSEFNSGNLYNIFCTNSKLGLFLPERTCEILDR